MGLFGSKNKDAAKKPVETASTAAASKRSVRRVVPANKPGAAPAKAQSAQIKPAASKQAVAEEVQVDDIQLPAATPVVEADQLDLGGVQFDAPAPAPVGPAAGKSPITTSSAPDFTGALGGGRSGPSRTGDQVLLEFLAAKVNLISAEQGNAARAKAEAEQIALDEALVKSGAITEEQLVNALSQETWVPHLKVDKYEIRKKALDTVSRDDAQHFGVFPVDKLGSLLTLAMVNPLDAEAIRQLEQKTGLDIKKVVASRSEIAQAIDKYYGGKVVASEGSRSFSQDVSESPKSATQMLGGLDPLPASNVVETGLPAMPDISAEIQDIDDLLGGEETIAPAIIEPVSIKPEDSLDGLELTDAAIASPEPAIIPAAAPVATLHDSEFEFGLPDPAKSDTSALSKPPVAEDLPQLDLEKTDEIKLPAALAPAPVVSATPAPKPAAPAPKPSVPAPAPKVAAPAEGKAGLRSATARITAGKAGSSKVVNLVPVLEEEFRYAISHGKAKVFERWVALQTRNRIVNAVTVEKELDGVLAGLYEHPRKAG